jgi:hypothetical protein
VLAHEGKWADPKTGKARSYDYDAVLLVAGGPARSPYDTAFNPLLITREQILGEIRWTGQATATFRTATHRLSQNPLRRPRSLLRRPRRRSRSRNATILRAQEFVDRVREQADCDDGQQP